LTFQETLRKVLRSADAAPEAVFGHDDVQEWPEGALAALVAAGLLSEAERARAVVCDGCPEACLADVEFLDLPGGPPRAYVICNRSEEMGRFAVPWERLSRWGVDLTRFAEWAARELGVSGGVEESATGRLWWLGRASVGPQRVDLFLARGAAWPDASTAFRSGRLLECPTPLVLVPCDVPIEAPFGAGAKVVSLVRLMVPIGGQMGLDREGVWNVIGKGRTRRTQSVVPVMVPLGMTWERLVIEFVRDEIVKVIAGEAVEHRTFMELGFRDNRKTEEEPDIAWAFFKILAQQNGEISPETYIDKAKKHVQTLRSRFRTCFPSIQGDPFEPYRRARAYKTKFILRGLPADR
jgi:hypothetical protein